MGGLDCVSCVSDGLCVCLDAPLPHLLRRVPVDASETADLRCDGPCGQAFRAGDARLRCEAEGCDVDICIKYVTERTTLGRAASSLLRQWARDLDLSFEECVNDSHRAEARLHSFAGLPPQSSDLSRCTMHVSATPLCV